MVIILAIVIPTIVILIAIAVIVVVVVRKRRIKALMTVTPGDTGPLTKGSKDYKTKRVMQDEDMS